MLKKSALAIILFYQYFISPLKVQSCRFYPSCSTFALQAIEKYGIFKGFWLIVGRLCRCHPGHPGGYDPLR